MAFFPQNSTTPAQISLFTQLFTDYFSTPISVEVQAEVLVTPPPALPPPQTWAELVERAASGEENTITVPFDMTVGGMPLVLGPGRTLTLVCGAPGVATCTFDGAGANSVINVATGSSLTLSGFTFVNASCGSDASCMSFGNGAAIYLGGATSLYVDNSRFVNCAAGDSGGAIYSLGDVAITNSTFTGNSAGTAAGAVYAEVSLDIQGAIFAGNSAVQRGGAISTGLNCNVSLGSVSFANNRAILAEGGALNMNGALEASAISAINNTAGTHGGVRG